MGRKKTSHQINWDLAGEMCCLSTEVYEASESLYLAPYGYQLHEFINDETVGTQCIIAISDEGRIAIAFRGTSDFKDAFTDILAIKKRWLHGKRLFFSPKVHFGFLNAYRPVRKRILKTIKKLAKKNRQRIYVTGHSLGGALATLCAADIRRSLRLQTTMYNFGGPRVGNRRFAKLYNKLVPDTFRFVNDADVIPTIPKIGYHHVGNLCYIDEGGAVQINPNIAMRTFERIQDMTGFLNLEKLTDHLSMNYRIELQRYTKKGAPLHPKNNNQGVQSYPNFESHPALQTIMQKPKQKMGLELFEKDTKTESQEEESTEDKESEYSSEGDEGDGGYEENIHSSAQGGFG